MCVYVCSSVCVCTALVHGRRESLPRGFLGFRILLNLQGAQPPCLAAVPTKLADIGEDIWKGRFPDVPAKQAPVLTR